MGVGLSLSETAAGIGILAGFMRMFDIFKTSSKCGFGLHSLGVSPCTLNSSDSSTVSKVFEAKVESSAVTIVIGVGRGIL